MRQPLSVRRNVCVTEACAKGVDTPCATMMSFEWATTSPASSPMLTSRARCSGPAASRAHTAFTAALYRGSALSISLAALHNAIFRIQRRVPRIIASRLRLRFARDSRFLPGLHEGTMTAYCKNSPSHPRQPRRIFPRSKTASPFCRTSPVSPTGISCPGSVPAREARCHRRRNPLASSRAWWCAVEGSGCRPVRRR
jgi:hypothetical protein